MFVIVDRTPGDEYRAVSKAGDVTLEITTTKARIRAIKGTDIMTYTVDSPTTAPTGS